MAGEIFAALADPNRRCIVETLTTDGRGTATQMAGGLGISRQAAAKHLQILASAGIVEATREGRETIYQPTPASLREIAKWIDEIESAWSRRLSRLAIHLAESADSRSR